MFETTLIAKQVSLYTSFIKAKCVASSWRGSRGADTEVPSRARYQPEGCFCLVLPVPQSQKEKGPRPLSRFLHPHQFLLLSTLI